MTYRPKRVLVTGGLGFIGSHVVEHLLRQISSVETLVNLDARTYAANPRNVPDHVQRSERYVLVHGSVTDTDLVLETLTRYEIDTVVHMAAETHVDRSFKASLRFTHTNVLGTHAMLQAAHTYGGVKRFVHVSTDEVYGDHQGTQALTEAAAACPTNPYAASKVGAEAMVRAYERSFGLPCIVTRGNNVYGPRQFPEKVVPKFAYRLLAGQDLPVHGDGAQLRSFMHVTDAARAFVTIVTKGQVGVTYNIGVDRETPIAELAAMLQAARPNSGSQVVHVEDRAFNDQRYFVDSTKLRALGWTPTIELEEGLATTLEWYERNPGYWPRLLQEHALQPHPGLEMKKVY